MSKGKWVVVLCMLVAMLLLSGCEGYSETNGRASEQQDGSGGNISVTIGKANGTTTKTLETGASGAILDAEVILTAAKGSYKIELLGENDEVTLTLEVKDGEALRGQGWMVSDSFGEASFRVTAVEAEDVVYSIVYVYR